MTEVTSSGAVTFRFFRPNVLEVHVVGTFNNWCQQAAPMVWQGDGWWTTTLNLMPGDHQFRYIADDQWYTDHAANGIEKSEGTWNSLLVVPEPIEIRRAA